MTHNVAGHTFEGRIDDVCACGRTWAEIADATDADVGKDGIAHTAHLTFQELEEIRTEKQRREEAASRAWAAIHEVCG